METQQVDKTIDFFFKKKIRVAFQNFIMQRAIFKILIKHFTSVKHF